MKKILFVLVIALLLPAALSAKSFKRGVAENQFSLKGQMDPIEPGVSWYYNWGIVPGTGYQNQVIDYTGFEYVPMAWNGVNEQKLREYCASHPDVKYLLGYNEPNFKDQANLTPARAAEMWPALRALCNELGLELVAPALNYSPDAPYQNPVTWMDEFVALVGPDAFDYTAIHVYGGLDLMKSLASTFHERYGKPVWVTEWCWWPGGAGDVYVAPNTQISSMIQAVEWLEKTPYIYRYAWFKCVGPHNSSNKPNYGLEISAAGQGNRELSPQGWVYTYMSEFNPDVWNAPATIVAASEYISSKGIMLAKGENDACPRPIEISQFSAGAWADYQFDVPAAGVYSLDLTVSGVGEPVRFDPNIKVSSVNPDGSLGATLAQKQFALSGSDEVYSTVSLEVTLDAGRQTLRLADAAPSQPSGIHISTLRLSDAAGVQGISADSVSAPVDVFTLAGVKVRSAVSAATATVGLPAGFYIVGSRKVFVK